MINFQWLELPINLHCPKDEVMAVRVYSELEILKSYRTDQYQTGFFLIFHDDNYNRSQAPNNFERNQVLHKYLKCFCNLCTNACKVISAGIITITKTPV